MAKGIFLLIKLGILGAIIFWFVINPGTVTIDWFSHSYRIHVGLALLGVIILSIVCMIVLYGILTLREIPQIWRSFQDKSRERRGYQNFTQGLCALAMEDFETAREKISKTQFFLGESPLPLILTALSAQRSNDYASAARAYGLLLKNKSTEFLGYYGLTQTTNAQKDYPASYLYAKKSFELESSSKWAILTLFQLSLRLENYDQSFYFLKKIKKHQVLKNEKLQHAHALFFYLQGMGMNDIKVKLKLLQKSFDFDSSFIPCVLAINENLCILEKYKNAQRVLEKSLKTNPHPDVAYQYVHLRTNYSSAQKVKRAEHVLKITNAHYVGHLILTQTAIEEGFTGIAQTHLDFAILINGGLCPKLNLLAQSLEDLDGIPTHISSQMTFSQKQEKVWQCHSCGYIYERWNLICVECDRIDTIDWKEPHLYHTPQKQFALSLIS
jgi:uncharacterized membrane-anchored protein